MLGLSHLEATKWIRGFLLVDAKYRLHGGNIFSIPQQKVNALIYLVLC